MGQNLTRYELMWNMPFCIKEGPSEACGNDYLIVSDSVCKSSFQKNSFQVTFALS
jgi:hypothetical protein